MLEAGGGGGELGWRAGMANTTNDEDLRRELKVEQQRHSATAKDLEVERAAHDETAERMVELQQRLEVTLQELANLERFSKQQQQPSVPADAPAQLERLLKEEAYLQSRLRFVQQELVAVRGAAEDGAADDLAI